MTTFTISLGSVCAGGNHATVNVARDGGTVRSFVYTADELLELNDPNDLQRAVLTIIRWREEGKTKLQMRNDLQTGFNVVI